MHYVVHWDIISGMTALNMKFPDNTILYCTGFAFRLEIWQSRAQNFWYRKKENRERAVGRELRKKRKQAVKESAEARAVLRLFIDRICLPANW